MISLLTLPLVGAALNLLDLLFLEALVDAFLPVFVPDRVILIFGKTVVPKFLAVSIIPMEDILDACSLIVFAKALLATILRLKLWVVLLYQIELHDSMTGLHMIWQVVCRLA